MGPGVMNIQVRVLAANAQRTLRGLRANIAAVRAESGATAAVSPVGKRTFADMTKAGNQMQWVGRQLQYNFTLPLVLAGAAATKFALDQQTAMVHVAKVYGDTTDAAKYWSQHHSQWMKGATSATDQATKTMNAELDALQKNFDALSVRYATQKKDVMEVAGAWAAAGVSGKELAKSVENTLIASNIGDMTPQKSTEALIAIQAQYNMSASQLTRTLADLNAIENATAVDMGGLITSMAKSGSAAAASGTSARYLAAMTAAITPAAGSASQAGNALKTILSRINKPTKQAADAMATLGINTDSVGWKALNGNEKLTILSKGFDKLHKSQQISIASSIAGIYQYNRLIQLLKDMGREHGNYNKALSATSSKDKVFATMNKELNTILESNPKRLQRMGIALQNSLANIITPLIPQMVYLVQQIASMAKWFDNLSPSVQKVALILAVLLITLPLVLRYMGSLKTLFVVSKIGAIRLAQALGLMATATEVNTVVDGQAIVVTEMRRKGLIGLFLVMLKAPFAVFASAGEFALAKVSAAFIFMGMSGVKAIQFLILRTAAPFAAYVAFMTQTVLRGGFAAAFKWTWASIVATFTRGSATVLAINGATGKALATQNLEASVASRGIWSRFASWFVGLFVSMRLRVLAAFASMVAFLANPAAIMAALGSIASAVGTAGATIVAAIFSPWGIAIALVVGALFLFRKQIQQIWENIVNYFKSSGDLNALFSWMVKGALSAFNALPQGVQNAMLAVVKVVRAAVLAVYDWFSYINPFAHHSPSLVENVTFGMKEVLKQFSTLSRIKTYTDGAYAELSKFGKLTAGISGKAQNAQFADDRKSLSKGGASDAALKSYDKLTGKLKSLQAIYARMGAAIDAYSKKDMVARRKMDDAIFNNEFAQKKLRLEMLKMEDVGGTIEDVTQKLQDLADAQAGLTELRDGLRQAGAGSDITSYYDTQLAALEAQKAPLEQAQNQLQTIQDQIDALAHKGEELDLEKAMKFDKVDYRLEKMKEQYDLIGQTISDITSGISAATQAQSLLNSAAAKGSKAGKGGAGSDAVGADFPDVTGKGLQGRTDWSSQVDQINKLTDAQIAKTSGLFAQVNPFKTFGGWFKKTWTDDVEPQIKSAGKWTSNFFGSVFKGVKAPPSVGKAGGAIASVFDKDKIAAALADTKTVVTKFFALFWPDLKRIFTSGWHAIQAGFDIIGPQITAFTDLWAPLGVMIKAVWKVIKPILALLVGIILLIGKVILSVFGHTIGPALKGLARFVAAGFQMIHGALQIVIGAITLIAGLLTLNGKTIKQGFELMGQGVLNIVRGMFKLILNIFTTGFQLLLGLVQGVVGGIFGFFKWLYDLLPGSVHDTVHAVVGFFKDLGGIPKWIYSHVIKPTVQYFSDGIHGWVVISQGAYTKVKGGLSGLKNLSKWLWDNSLGAVYSKFKDLWKMVGDWLGQNKSKVTSPIKSVMNFVISAINKMISGLNKVADVLPGISWHIKAIPGLEEGGPIPNRRVGNGFMTNGARAIVGEGKPNHPEYVIPTDPTHRGRAINLFSQLGQRLGVLDRNRTPVMDRNMQYNAAGVPMYSIGGAIGGALGKAGDLAKSAGSKALDFLAKHAKNAASFLYKPFGAVADHFIGKIDWNYAHDSVKAGHQSVKDWIGGADKYFSGVAKAGGRGWKKPLHKPYTIGGGIGSYKGHNGQDFPTPVGSSVYAITGGKVKTSADLVGNQVGGYRSYGRYIKIEHANGLSSLYAHNSKRIATAGQQVLPGQLIAKSGQTGNTTGPHVHLSAWKSGQLLDPLTLLRQHGIRMGKGGIAKATSGGVDVTVAEKGQDEAVIPLPRGWKNDGEGPFGKKEYNFYDSTFEFPNVTDGDDAQDFLENLDSVVKD